MKFAIRPKNIPIGAAHATRSEKTRKLILFFKLKKYGYKKKFKNIEDGIKLFVNENKES